MQGYERVKMLKDDVGYPDGITKTDFVEGEEYDLPAHLVKCFVDSGSGKLIASKDSLVDDPNSKGGTPKKSAK